MIEKQELFCAGRGGYPIYRIPGLVVTPGGAVLATCEARRGEGGDWDANDILMRRSLDGGCTWEPVQPLLAAEPYGPGPLSNAVMAPCPRSKTVLALFCHDYNRVFQMASADDGVTFSRAVEITTLFEPFRHRYPWQVVALGPGHATLLRSGRIIVPLWMSDGSGTEFGPGKRGHRPSCVASIYSDDEGAIWQRGEIAVPPEGFHNPSETLCVELGDRRVLFNVRNESPENRRLVTISPNGVGNWSPPVFHPDLLEPVCMASMIRHSFGASEPGRVLFANPNTLEREFSTWGEVVRDRKNLTVKLSRNDGLTWPVSRVIEPGPSGYSDLAVLPDGGILLLYECGMLEQMAETRTLTLARFDLDWLEGKQE